MIDITEVLENGEENVKAFRDELTASEIDAIVHSSRNELFYAVCNAYLFGYQRGVKRGINLPHKGLLRSISMNEAISQAIFEYLHNECEEENNE